MTRRWARVPAEVRHLVLVNVQMHGVWRHPFDGAQRHVEIAGEENALLQREVFVGQVDRRDAANLLARHVIDRRAHDEAPCLRV